MKTITIRNILARALFLTFLCVQSQVFAFSVGDKVQANGLVYVRATAGGTYLGQQASGTIGTVLAGPTYSQIGGTGTYYYWYSIDWPSAPDGWVADVGLILAPASAPIVQTLAASSITTSSAQINGSVNPNGASTTAYFQFGTTISYGNNSGSLSGITTSQNIYSIWTGLSPNTTYHYRIVAYNSGGTSYGSDVTFTTSAPAPTATTVAATSITATTAQLNGNINGNGLWGTVYWQYGTTTSYGYTTPSGDMGPTAGSGSYSISSLSPNTVYHFRVVASSSGGTTYGGDLTFTTSSSIGGGFVINPIFDATITSNPSAANTINAAIQAYETHFSDPITVTIKFQNMDSGLGRSETYGMDVSYTSFLIALSSDAKTAKDATALAHLPAGPNNPANGNASIHVTAANLRALGINATPTGGSPDSTISLHLSLMNLDRVTINPGKYDLLAVVMHEINEALGFGSALTGLGNGAAAPTGPIEVLDVFRFNQNAQRSFDTALATAAYFSIDSGVNRLARFNQDQSLCPLQTYPADFNDFFSGCADPGPHTPQVQDAFQTPGATPNLGVELTMLDVIGYDLTEFETVTHTGNTVFLTWDSIPGRVYQVQYKSSLNQPTWTDLGGTITAAGATASSSDSIGPDRQRFYRITLMPAPAALMMNNQQQPLFVPLTVKTKYLLPAHP